MPEAPLLADLVEELRTFARERDWSRFHDPKNLSMLAGSECGELLALFRWVANEDSDAFAAEPRNRERIAEEVADTTIALLMLCDRIGLDLAAAVRRKIEKNRLNYPLELRGKADRKG